MKSNQVVVSGMRPTGLLHLGHYFGVLKNWVQLQEKFRCYFFVADWHSLTTEYAQIDVIQKTMREIVIDWVACGIDPEKSVLFVQSRVPEHAELHLLLSMITPISWLERVPSYKELRQELKGKDLSMYGFLGYPLLQTADVAIYKATQVPVGQDQAAHIELAREILRRFNFLYCGDKPLFPEPQTLMTNYPKVPGIDGRKMSKSYNNTITLSDSEEAANKKIMQCITDPARIKREIPGNPDVCTVFSYHKLVTGEGEKKEIDRDCRSAALGCVDCKKKLIRNMTAELAPFRKRRLEIAKAPEKIDKILENGNAAARKVAAVTLAEVNRAMGLEK